MEKTIKVRCIKWKGSMFTVGKTYSVEGGFIIDNNMHHTGYNAFTKSRFEIVEEKPVMIKIPSLEAAQNNMTDMINRNLCSGIKPAVIILKSQEDIEKYFGYKKFKMTVLDEAGVFYPQSDANWKNDNSNIMDDIDGACSIIKKTGQSIRYKWQFNAHTYNLIDGFNRMKCTEKKFKGMHVPYMRDIIETIKEKPAGVPRKITITGRDYAPVTNDEPNKKVEYHEPGFKSKWDTVGI